MSYYPEEIQGLVSIIIPAYNAEKWIERSVRSALNQTYQNVEVLVVENGSTDGTIDILKQYDNRKLSIYQSEKGVSNARNKGMYKARGEYLTFLDADDWLEDDAIEKMISLMGPDVDIVSARYSGDKPFEQYKSHRYEAGDEEYILKCLYTPTKRGNSTGNLYRAGFIKEVGAVFNPTLSHAEDSVFFIELLINNPVVVDLEEPVYHVYVNPDSATRGNIDIKGFCDAIKLVYKHLESTKPQLKNAGYIFAVNQLLVILVHSGKKGLDQKRFIREACSIKVFREAIMWVDPADIGMIQKALVVLMKKKQYSLLTIATTLRKAQNMNRRNRKK